MIEIPTHEVQMDDYEKVVREVLSQLATGKDKHDEGCIGTAYIDWGVTGDFYKNCPSRSIADKVARAFKEKGYYVYPTLFTESIIFWTCLQILSKEKKRK